MSVVGNDESSEESEEMNSSLSATVEDHTESDFDEGGGRHLLRRRVLARYSESRAALWDLGETLGFSRADMSVTLERCGGNLVVAAMELLGNTVQGNMAAGDACVSAEDAAAASRVASWVASGSVAASAAGGSAAVSAAVSAAGASDLESGSDSDCCQ